jgi:hypothetical protein
MLLPMTESHSPQEKKHEEDRSQAHPGCIDLDRVRLCPNFGQSRLIADARVLAQPVSRAVRLSAVSGWFTLATHR